MLFRQLLCCVLFLGFATPCLGQPASGDINKNFTADILKATLFARTVSEKSFCDYVIQKRDEGVLPTQILYAVHQKAMKKDRGRRFVYFKTALEIVCKREGIRL